MCLAKRVIEHLPPQCLLICDRYYGVGAFLGLVVPRLESLSSMFLLRVRSNIRTKRLVPLSDGSALVDVKVPGASSGSIMVREIRGRLRREGGKWTDVRFWTSFLDHKSYPAEELIALGNCQASCPRIMEYF
jgi:hypothetical protein